MNNQKTIDENYNSKNIDEILLKFKVKRTAFSNKIKILDKSDLKRIVFHPRLQQNLRLIDMAFFICEHDDHHINRMYEIQGLLK